MLFRFSVLFNGEYVGDNVLYGSLAIAQHFVGRFLRLVRLWGTLLFLYTTYRPLFYLTVFHWFSSLLCHNLDLNPFFLPLSRQCQRQLFVFLSNYFLPPLNCGRLRRNTIKLQSLLLNQCSLFIAPRV